MDEFIMIKVMNEAMIKLLKTKNKDCEKNIKLKEYLNDEGIFFKISKIHAMNVLTSVGVADDRLETTYQKLIKKETYDKLLQEGKIKITDNLTVKYN